MNQQIAILGAPPCIAGGHRCLPGINMLFLVGGDGTQFAGNLLYEAARKRQLPVSIVGIPKSIDNESWLSGEELMIVVNQPTNSG